MSIHVSKHCQTIFFMILGILGIHPCRSPAKITQTTTHTHSKPPQNHSKPFKVIKPHSEPPQNYQLWFHVGSSWLNLGASWPSWPSKSSILASCCFKLAVQVGLGGSRTSKHQGKTTCFSIFQNPIVDIIWVQVGCMLAQLGPSQL